jgi:hypothetical protein
LAQFTLQVREQKCVEKILEKAKITDVAAEKAAKTKKRERVIRTKPKKGEK